VVIKADEKRRERSGGPVPEGGPDCPAHSSQDRTVQGHQDEEQPHPHAQEHPGQDVSEELSQQGASQEDQGCRHHRPDYPGKKSGLCPVPCRSARDQTGYQSPDQGANNHHGGEEEHDHESCHYRKPEGTCTCHPSHHPDPSSSEG
jgi:hypothetical protein